MVSVGEVTAGSDNASERSAKLRGHGQVINERADPALLPPSAHGFAPTVSAAPLRIRHANM